VTDTTYDELTEVDIAPEVSVLGVFRHLNYRPWFAVAEFVDNALESFLVHEQDLAATDGQRILRVRIAFDPADPSCIRVTDNAAGISRDDWKRALRPADPPPDTYQLSEFGMGMKTAAAWFGRLLLVRSKALGEPMEREAFLDFDEIVATKRTKAEVRGSPANPREHGTTVEVMALHKTPQTRTVAKIREHLASIYRSFIRSGQLELIFQVGSGPEERLEPEGVDILNAPRFDDLGGESLEWRKEASIDLGDGVRVFGFAGLRAAGSTSKAGFALFRRGRLIMGSADETYRPPAIFGASTTAVYQRLFGELNVQGLDVTHTKDGFRWGDIEDRFISELRQVLDSEPIPLLRQARLYSYRLQREPDADLRREATEAAQETASIIRRGLPGVAETQLAPAEVRPPETELGEVSELFAQTVSVDIEDERWDITVEFSNDLQHDADWVEVAERPQSVPSGRGSASRQHFRLRLRMSLRHPFTQHFAGVTYENLDLLMRLGAAMVLAEVFARQSGVTGAGEVRRRFNDLLRSVFANS